MSNILQFPDTEDAAPEICGWIARLDRGLTEQEERELRGWLASSPKRLDQLIEAASLWDRMESLSRLADLFPRPINRRAHQTRWLWAAAAALVLVLSAGLLLLGVDSSRTQSYEVSKTSIPQQSTYETQIGEHSTIRLIDGSELTLNTNSLVQTGFNNSSRSIRLKRGEMYIRVAHDSSRPLTVWAGDHLVRAIGTAFNVQITADHRVEVIVTDGKVLIGVMKPDATSSQPAWIESLDTPILAGQRALLGDSAQVVEEIEPEEIEVKLSWREGNLVFHGEPLAEALGEIERYTPVSFVIQDEELKTIRVAGMFKAGDVDGLLETLRNNFNISYERIDSEKIVLKNE